MTSSPRVSRRTFLLGASGALVTLGVAACGSGSDGGSTDEAGATVDTKYGEIGVPADPQRVVSVGYNDQDTLLALGVVPAGVFDWYGDYPGATWPWAQSLLGGATPEIVGTAAEGIDVEKVAAVGPDLIVGTYAGVTQGEYDQLSALAPTVTAPPGVADFGIAWRDQTRLLGAAVGKSAEADTRIADVEDKFASVVTANPSFAGKTVLVGALQGPAQFGVYGAQDPKVRFLNDLGFVNPPVAAQVGDANFAAISTEQLSLADVDLLVWYAGGGFGDKLRAELAVTPVYQQLPVVQDGRVIVLEDEAAEAMAWSTVLSLPFALDQIPGRLAPLVR
ncbi:iron-siderophore ABC transporter substrate-binding protein [Rhodococcoides corynebacterioides]|uniref:iron-siderophore ABC transporter substrate-binding protein n=1 Tax=Rhodococcoides corynebacterioides TaxID=53972 RepID=UPI00082F15C8|nr:iron-siderophore ABC transporter substrate-binding protein [Rhodococcus corynebacterioides]